MSTPEIGLYADATPDEQIAYSMGWNTATAIARTEAFAAIRRAAKVARILEVRWRDYDQARVVRHAIRVAIKSEKADA